MTTTVQFFAALAATACFASVIAVWRRNGMTPTGGEFIPVALVVLAVAALFG